ncbi:MAG: hypothetical protein JXP34_21100 [Planctomycetes bacterium]|nr:hypothetical protein [Planctomycetota bacterium]
MPGRFPRFDRTAIRTMPLADRVNLMGLADLLPLDARTDDIGDPHLDRVAARIREARQRGEAVVVFIGAHVIKVGLSYHLIDLMRRGWITHLAGNGAVSIHDFELALIGASTEDVGTYLANGMFGMAEETGRGIHDALRRGRADGLGYGESVGRAIVEGSFPHRDASVLAGGYDLGIPVTIHVSIGLDIIHQHPACDGATLGWATDQDFLIFVESVRRLGDRGVFLNFGSQVAGPEVFLKALSMVRNRGAALREILTANFDLRRIDLRPDDADGKAKYARPDYYYRPKKNIVLRPNYEGGEGYHICGDHRATIPALRRRLIDTGSA